MKDSRCFDYILPISTHTQRFGLTISVFVNKNPYSDRLLPKYLLDLGLTSRLGRTFIFCADSARTNDDTASTCDAENIYIDKTFVLSQLDNIFSSVQFWWYVLLIYRTNHSLQVQKRNCQRYPDSRMELVTYHSSLEQS